ncbi:MAG: hypothetical protein ABI797_05030, partial [Chloroflexota bacterium]
PTQAATPTALAPTGSRIIYSRQQRLGAVCDGGPPDAKLYVLDPDDPEQEPYRLTRYSNLFELDPAWSADGSRLAVVGSIGRGPGGINTMSPAGDTVELLLEGRRTPGIGIFARTGLTIAPNGHAIVHHQDEFMWRTDLGGGGLVQIGGPIPPEVPGPEDPTPTEFFVHVEYRAAGDLLALMRPVGGGPRWLELMAEDGSERQRLEFDLDGLDVVGFALASDDDLIAFVTFDATTETNSLMVGSLGEGRAGLAAVPIALDTVEQPAFSPRGDRLVLEGGSPGAQQLYEVKSESGEVRQLTHEAEFQACSPVWRDAPPDLAQPWPEPIAGESRRFELGLLVPGTYLNDITQPPVALTFTDGWYARRNYADGWSVWRPEGPLGEVDYGRIQFGPDNPCGEGDLLSIGNTPEALLTHLKARDDLSVTEVGPINLSGYPGITASISGIEGQGCGVEGDPAFEYWSLFPTGEDQFSLSTGEGLRLVTLDVGGSARSFLVFAGVDELDAYWDDYARPLLQTATYPTP